MTAKVKIQTADAPTAIGPYSQGVEVLGSNGTNSLIFVSGQLPIDPQTSKLVEGDIRVKTQRVIQNLEAILHAAGSDLEHVVRLDVFVKDLGDFAAVNEEMAKKFTGPVLPARQTIQPGKLPLDASVEISCIAVRR